MILLAASQALVDLHLVLAWVVIIANGLAGLWALAAHRDERFRVKQLWWFTAFAEIAVFGAPDDYYGEVVAAAVRLKAETSSAGLAAFAADRIARFKVPVRIWFKEEPLPRNPNGKIMKRDLKAELLPR